VAEINEDPTRWASIPEVGEGLGEGLEKGQ